MQTLLVSPARRSEIVAGKYLAVLTVCLVTTGLNLGSLGLTFSHLFLPGELARNASLTFAPTAGSLAAMMLVMLPLAGLFCAACLGLSAYASTYKEAMLYLSPFLLVATVGAMAPIIPGLRPSAGLQLVPVANAAVLLHQVVQGTAGLGAVALNVAVNAAYALLALRWAAWIFEREDVLLRGAAEIDWRLRRRPAARRSHPSVVEGVVYVLLSFAAAVALGHVLLGAPFLSILAVSQLGGFLLPLLVMLAAGGIDARRALRLRFPGWTNLAVGGLTAAAALVLSQVSFECLVGLYRRMGLDPLRSMQELLRPFQDALGPHRSAVELAFAGLLFAGLAPLCEELAFRGFLLSALRPAVGSAASVAVTGVLFGALHGMPPRCFVLAGLGMLFGAMVVRSGSLWVGVAAHAVNNGLVVLLAASGGAAPGPLDNLLAGLRAADPRTVALVALAAVVAPLGLLLLRPPPGPAPGDPPPLPSGPAIYSANKY
jgi:sodium transport system permease protein